MALTLVIERSVGKSKVTVDNVSPELAFLTFRTVCESSIPTWNSNCNDALADLVYKGRISEGPLDIQWFWVSPNHTLIRVGAT